MRILWLTVMIGLFTARMSQSAQEFRAARSVHLSYADMEGEAFYNECRVEKSTPGSYFMVCGWDTGYCGIQELGNGKKVLIFSVWDPTAGDNPASVKSEDRVEVLFEAEGTRIKRFGGEGTGGQCMRDFEWQIGGLNRFIIVAQTETNQVRKTSYTAFVHSLSTDTWEKLATFRVRTKHEGLRGLYSFVEDFRRDKKSVFDLRKAEFGNGWVKSSRGEWKSISKARFTASNAAWESKENIDAGMHEEYFFLATGGDIHASHELKGTLELAEPPRHLPMMPTTVTLPTK